ncbi:MAG: SemiSWEET transporter [Candidatus Helarchaeota archaeon]|nr:SemiSWEET transporter [Candidatus Helarchaeota archaeon]
MDYVTLLGLVAALLTSLAFLPQAIKSYRTKQTKDLSLPMMCVQSSGNFLWLIYGIAKTDIAIISANAITFFFAFCLLMLKIKHK